MALWYQRLFQPYWRLYLFCFNESLSFSCIIKNLEEEPKEVVSTKSIKKLIYREFPE